MEPRPQRLLFMFTEDWAFASLFLDRAIAAKNAGYEVAVHVRCSEHRTVIEQAGLKVIPHNLSGSCYQYSNSSKYLEAFAQK